MAKSPTLSGTVSFAKELWQNWNDDKCFRLGAALSYYTLFSIAPLLVIMISIMSYFFGREAVTGQLYKEIRGLVGSEGALGIQNMVENAYKEDQGLLPTIVGFGTLFMSGTLIFITLQESFNDIWAVRAKPKRGWLKLIIDRVISFSLVIGIGFGLLVSLVLNAVLTTIMGYLASKIGDVSAILLRVAEQVVTVGVITLLLAMMFKFLPDAQLRWKDTWRAAFLTSILFTVGKSLIGLYLGSSNLASTYGAAASVVILIVWVNYTSWILFFGAEYMKVWLKRRGRAIQPRSNAVKIVRKEVERDGTDEAKEPSEARKVIRLGS